MTQQELIDAISNMTVIELAELVKALEAKFGVSAAAPVAAAAVGPTSAVPAQEEEEQTEFDVVLTGAGDQKIQVIKAIKEAVSKDEAADIKKKIEEVGGTVEVK